VADEKRNRLQDAEIDLLGEADEQDVLFKSQMAVANFFLGYWKYGIVLLGVVLVVALVYGLVENRDRDRQREIQAGIARVELTLPKDERTLPFQPLDDPADTERTEKLVKAAQGFEKVAATGDGVAATMAWIRAAEVWERTQRPEDATRAWQRARETSPTHDILGWAAASGLANSLANSGKVDEAAALYREFADQGPGAIGEWALFDLGTLYLDTGRSAESTTVFSEFTQKYPDSLLAGQVAEALSPARDDG